MSDSKAVSDSKRGPAAPPDAKSPLQFEGDFARVGAFTGLTESTMSTEACMQFEFTLVLKQANEKLKPYLEVYRARGSIWERIAVSSLGHGDGKDTYHFPSMMLNVDTLCYHEMKRGVRVAVWDYKGRNAEHAAIQVAEGFTTPQAMYLENKQGQGATVDLVHDGGKAFGIVRVEPRPLFSKTTFGYLVHNGATVRDRNQTVHRKMTGCLARISVTTDKLSILIWENRHYLEFYRQEVSGKWLSVYKTEIVEPMASHYDTFLVPMHDLCFEDIARPIRIKVKVFEGSKKIALFAGELYTTLRDMILNRTQTIEMPYTPSDDEVKSGHADASRERAIVNAAKDKRVRPSAGTMSFKSHIFTPWSDLPTLVAGADLTKKVTYKSTPETTDTRRSMRQHLWSHLCVPAIQKPITPDLNAKPPIGETEYVQVFKHAT